MANVYWIHGNGLSSAVLPEGVLGDDMPGHGKANWDQSLYTINKLTRFFVEKIPPHCHVIGHSLGGHLAINVALERPDIKVTNLGMVPADTFDAAMAGINPTSAFQNFSSPKRTYQDLVNFSEYLTPDLNAQSSFINSMMQQDPIFSETLFSKGFEDYDWNELEKIKSMGADRFTLVINEQDELINAQVAADLPINTVRKSMLGHAPWQPRSQHHSLNRSKAPTTLGIPL